MYKEILQTAHSVGYPCSDLSQLLLFGEPYRSSDICSKRRSIHKVYYLKGRCLFMYEGLCTCHGVLLEAGLKAAND